MRRPARIGRRSATIAALAILAGAIAVSRGSLPVRVDTDGGLHDETRETLSVRRARGDAQRRARASDTLGITEKIKYTGTAGWTREQPMGLRSNDWEPALAAHPSSTHVYLATTRFGAPRECKNCPRPKIVLRHSIDGGKTFGGAFALCRCSGSRWQYDPILELDAQGTLHAVWLDGFSPGVSYARSEDGGRTFTDPVAVEARWSDKPAMAVSDDGRDIYIAFNGPTRGDPFMSWSHDAGRTWTTEKIIDGPRYWFAGDGIVSPNGRVVFAQNVFNQTYTGDIRTAIIMSRNGGNTWHTSTVDVTSRQPDCRSAGCYDGYYGSVPAIAVDPDNDLLIAYAGTRSPAGKQHQYVKVSNNGVRWTARRTLSDPDALSVYSAATSTGDDAYHVWFMDKRSGRLNVWARRTTDGGATWSPARRLSNAISGAAYKDKRGFKEAYGDYGEMETTGGGHVVAIWGEGTSFNGPGGSWYTRSR